jgi:hypothetical protein
VISINSGDWEDNGCLDRGRHLGIKEWVLDEGAERGDRVQG